MIVSGSEYQTVHQCDNCNLTDLHCNTLPCGRYLCMECKKKVECPCHSCQTTLPAFRARKNICPKCTSEMPIDQMRCEQCYSTTLETASMYDLFSQLVGRIFCIPIAPERIRPTRLQFNPDRVIQEITADLDNLPLNHPALVRKPYPYIKGQTIPPINKFGIDSLSTIGIHNNSTIPCGLVPDPTNTADAQFKRKLTNCLQHRLKQSHSILQGQSVPPATEMCKAPVGLDGFSQYALAVEPIPNNSNMKLGTGVNTDIDKKYLMLVEHSIVNNKN